MNKLLPLILAFVVVILGTVIYYATRERPETPAYLPPATGEGPRVGDLRGRPTGKPGDRDGAQETIRTLTQLQERLNQELETERNKNRALGEKLDQTRLDVTQSLSEQQQQVEQHVEKRLKQALESMKEKFKVQSEKGQRYIEQKLSDLPRTDDKPQPGAMPEGLGFDGLPIGGVVEKGDHGLDLKPPPRYLSVKPMGVSLASVDSGETGGLLSGLPGLGLLGGRRDSDGDKQAKSLETVREEAAKQDKQPRYTINDVATLYQNTTMTALLGRVPVDNKVSDPYRFKVITGGDNLAASGLTLPPNIKHIVWTGYTIGNRELACADGYLDTVTLVFQDGTISTTTVKQPTSKKSPTRKYLGYITDPWGKPCISGQLFSNASDYLRDRILVGALGAAAQGAAAAETTTLSSADDYFQTIVSGDTTEYILGQAAAGGLDETKEFVRERMRNAYDVVYVGTGRKVTIHVESEIHFDYDPKGRKLDHGVTDKTALADFD